MLADPCIPPASPSSLPAAGFEALAKEAAAREEAVRSGKRRHDASDDEEEEEVCADVGRGMHRAGWRHGPEPEGRAVAAGRQRWR